MRLVYDPVREHFLKPIIAAEPYVEDLVETVADIRMSAQKKTLGWAHSYFGWAERVLQNDPMYTRRSDEAEMVAKMLVMMGVPLSYVPFAMVTVGSYLNPWTAAIAAPLDAWNVYRYFYE